MSELDRTPSNFFFLSFFLSNLKMFSNFPCHKGERQVEGGEEGGGGEKGGERTKRQRKKIKGMCICVCAYAVDNECFLLLFL